MWTAKYRVRYWRKGLRYECAVPDAERAPVEPSLPSKLHPSIDWGGI
jgi:hypothetical protein